MLEQQVVNYYTLIPPSLHKEVDELLYYLATYPFEQPSECAHCGSINFTDNKTINPLSKIINYRCNDCKKGFNQLTHTCFAKTQFIHLDKWDEFAKLRLSGKSINQICTVLQLSTQAATKRDRNINILMQQEYPKLFAWWKTHQDREKLNFSEPVKQQADKFIHWLEKLITQPVATCPTCSRPDCKRVTYALHRPQFQCYTCELTFNLLSNTCFLNMGYIEHWLDYVKLLIQGYGDNDISKLLGIKSTLSNAWKYKFIKQMQILELSELVQWLTWQRSRRYNQATIQRKMANKRLKAKNNLNG